MGSLRRTMERRVGSILNGAALLLLIAGAIIGWVLPQLSQLDLPIPVAERLSATHLDASSYLGADITALAVLIAVVIGFNITVLQIASQAHSLRLIRGLLATLLPFLLTWCLTTAIALIAFLVPPVYVSQLWQQLAWFGAVVLLMLGYLWDLPWRLSGAYVALWVIRGLKGTPVAEWESIEGYSAFQTAVTSAGARGDLGALRALTFQMSRFLVETRDRKAESADTYNRGRYRALKSLLSGCAQGAATAPTAFSYYIGYLEAGVLLQAVAGGHPADEQEHELFSGVLRAVRGNQDQLNPLWTGLRHALCRPADRSTPLLLRYWLGRAEWQPDDPRLIERIAVLLARFHRACWDELRGTVDVPVHESQAAEMIADLYRDIALHLVPAVARTHHRATHFRLSDLPLTLLDSLHTHIMRLWPSEVHASAARLDLINTYEKYRGKLTATLTHVGG